MTDRATEARLALCAPEAVPRFRAALGRAIAYGADAYIERNPWRTAEQQAEKVRLGLSQVLDSAHRQTIDGDPAHAHAVITKMDDDPRLCACGLRAASRAIHLVSEAHFYFALAPGLLPAFAVRVGAAALKEGLTWGGLYGPKDRDPRKAAAWDPIWAALKIAAFDEQFQDAEAAFVDGQHLGACWDPLHIEWRPA